MPRALQPETHTYNRTLQIYWFTAKLYFSADGYDAFGDADTRLDFQLPIWYNQAFMDYVLILILINKNKFWIN